MKSFIIQVNHEDNYICRKLYGDLVLEEISDSWQEILKVPEFVDHNYDLITDYTDSTVQISANSLGTVLNFYKEHQETFRGKRHAVIVSKPRQTAFSKLFKQQYDNKDGIEFEMFENKEAALSWLKNK